MLAFFLWKMFAKCSTHLGCLGICLICPKFLVHRRSKKILYWSLQNLVHTFLDQWPLSISFSHWLSVKGKPHPNSQASLRFLTHIPLLQISLEGKPILHSREISFQLQDRTQTLTFVGFRDEHHFKMAAMRWLGEQTLQHNHCLLCLH